MADIKKIGIWGTAHAGKTTYIAMLYRAFLQAFDEWEVTADNGVTEQFLRAIYERLLHQKAFPEKTVTTNHYAYLVKHRQNHYPEFLLEMLDAAGELYEAYYNDPQHRQKTLPVEQHQTEALPTDLTPEAVIAALKECDGILVFADPLRTESDDPDRKYDRILVDLFEELRRHRQQKQTPEPFIALCFPKVDGKAESWQKRHIDHTRCYRQDGVKPDTLDTSYCADSCLVFKNMGSGFMTSELPGLISMSHVRCFALSSIGRAGDRPNIGGIHTWMRARLTSAPPTFARLSDDGLGTSEHEPFAYLRQSLSDIPLTESYNPKSINRPDDIQPFNLLGPIRWILDCLAK